MEEDDYVCITSLGKYHTHEIGDIMTLPSGKRVEIVLITKYLCRGCGIENIYLNPESEGWFIDMRSAYLGGHSIQEINEIDTEIRSGKITNIELSESAGHLCGDCRIPTRIPQKLIDDMINVVKCERCLKFGPHGEGKWNLNSGHIYNCLYEMTFCYDCHEIVYYNK